MPSVKRGVTARARHKKVLDQAKGFRGRRKNVFRIAKQAVMRAGQYAYRDRRNKKRVFRQLWIARINAARASLGMTLQRVHGRPQEGRSIDIDRKVLADMAVNDQAGFGSIVEKVQGRTWPELAFAGACAAAQDHRRPSLVGCPMSVAAHDRSATVVDSAVADFAARARLPSSRTPRRAISASRAASPSR